MFTGIIEEIGEIASIERGSSSLKISVKCAFFEELALGESVAVNGACMTVCQKDDGAFFADVTPESFRRTSLGALFAGAKVNLERAIKADGRFGGHFVSGHIDGKAKIQKIALEENAANIFFRADKNLLRGIVEKGSVALDGVSLTVASVQNGGFSVAVIPHTFQNTTLSQKKVGDELNLECDIIGKYIEKFVQIPKSEENLSADFLTNFTSFH